MSLHRTHSTVFHWGSVQGKRDSTRVVRGGCDPLLSNTRYPYSVRILLPLTASETAPPLSPSLPETVTKHPYRDSRGLLSVTKSKDLPSRPKVHTGWDDILILVSERYLQSVSLRFHYPSKSKWKCSGNTLFIVWVIPSPESLSYTCVSLGAWEKTPPFSKQTSDVSTSITNQSKWSDKEYHLMAYIVMYVTYERTHSNNSLMSVFKNFRMIR